MLIPTLDLSVFGGGAGGLGAGNDRDVRITNPMTDLRRDLVLGEDRPLMRVRTSQPNPEYLHISLLTVFTGQAWTPGGRDLPARQAADGQFPDPNGMSDTVPRTTSDWDVEILDNFRSLWLPTSEYVESMNAGEDWRYDSETLGRLRRPPWPRHRRHVLLADLAGAAVQRADDGRCGGTTGRHRRAVHRAAEGVPAERARPGGRR